MKVLPFKIPKVTDHSFTVQYDSEPYFYDTLHQHPETQITLITHGTGTLILGDYIGEFAPGDVILVGANIPHVFRSDKYYYQDQHEGACRAISLFFDEDSFGSSFFGLPEMLEIKQMLNNSGRGLKLVGNQLEEIQGLITDIDDKNGVERMIDLLKILRTLSSKEQTVFLSSETLNASFKETEGQRLNDIFQFTMQEYQRSIALEEVANIANMTVSAFCRYFKQRTRKTYINFLNEVRIGQACKMLVNEDHPIGEVCYRSGFNNLSHFNRQFKAITGFSPREYVRSIKLT